MTIISTGRSAIFCGIYLDASRSNRKRRFSAICLEACVFR